MPKWLWIVWASSNGSWLVSMGVQGLVKSVVSEACLESPDISCGAESTFYKPLHAIILVLHIDMIDGYWYAAND